MIRILSLAGVATALASCSLAPTNDVLNALAQDKNSVSVDLTLSTPWGTEHLVVQRNIAAPATGGAP